MAAQPIYVVSMNNTPHRARELVAILVDVGKGPSIWRKSARLIQALGT